MGRNIIPGGQVSSSTFAVGHPKDSHHPAYSCAMHLVYGRLSDIVSTAINSVRCHRKANHQSVPAVQFGRKAMLQLALLFLGFGNLLCGFAKTPIQLYVFRAISGLGGGGINGIAMTVVSRDLVVQLAYH